MVSISPTVIYEFPLDGRLKPFARGGIGILAGRGGGAAFWNIGGGVDYWFKERMGLRVEVRDSFDTNPRYGFLDFMFGLVFKY